MATLIKLHRFNTTEKSTTGILTIDGDFFCYTIEDTHQEEKVAGKTRIPAGFYEIKLREDISPMTERYQKKYHFFTRHLQLTNVPNFKYVYVHVGNRAEDSEGCILLGSTCGQDFVGNSSETFERFYTQIQPKLLAGGRVYIAINDEIASF